MTQPVARTLKPRITVAAVIEKDGKFLMVRETLPMQGTVINQPAGHVENGETLIEAVRREVLEETAYDFQPTGWIGLYRWCSPFTQNTQLRLCFVGQVGAHHAERALDEPIDEALWLSHEEIKACADEHRSPLVQKCIEDSLRLAAIDLQRLVEPEMLGG